MTPLTSEQISARIAAISDLFREGLSDRDIAQRLGLSEPYVVKHRRLAGLKRHRGGVFDPKLRNKIGKLHARGFPDREIARRLAICHSTASNHRIALGLGANPTAEWRHRVAVSDVSALVKSGLSDPQIAERLGHRVEWVGKLRREAGLRSNRPTASSVRLSRSEAFALRALQTLFSSDRPAVPEELAGRIMAARVAQERRA